MRPRPVLRETASAWRRPRLEDVLHDVEVDALGSHLGEAGHPVAQDALDAGLEGHGRHGAAAAGAEQLDVDHAGLLVEVEDAHVAAVRLEGGAYGLYGFEQLCLHGHHATTAVRAGAFCRPAGRRVPCPSRPSRRT